MAGTGWLERLRAARKTALLADGNGMAGAGIVAIWGNDPPVTGKWAAGGVGELSKVGEAVQFRSPRSEEAVVSCVAFAFGCADPGET